MDLIGGRQSGQICLNLLLVKYRLQIYNFEFLFLQQAIEQSKKEHETNVVEKHRLIRMAEDKVCPRGIVNALFNKNFSLFLRACFQRSEFSLLIRRFSSNKL